MDKETVDPNLDIKADDPALELEGDVKETETKDLDVKIEDVPNSSGEKEEDGAKIVSDIKNKILGIEDEKKDEEGADIPDVFTNYCLKQGWTEDEIKEFAADLDDKALLEEIVEEESKEKPAEKQGAKEEKSKPAEKAADKPTNDEIAKLTAKYDKEIAALKEQFSEADKVKSAKEEEATNLTVNQAFDEAAEKFKIFGKTEELLKYPAGPKKGQFVPTSPAMKARLDVWEKAAPFIDGGIPVEEAMEIALTWYKGANLEKDVERKLIKDLKKHETKLSAKRSGKETVKTYEDEDERKGDVVREAARKAGVKGEYGL